MLSSILGTTVFEVEPTTLLDSALSHPFKLLSTLFLLWIVFRIISALVRPDPYDFLPHAPRKTFLFGNQTYERSHPELQPGESLVMWGRELKSNTYVFPDVFGSSAVYSYDPAFLQFVLADAVYKVDAAPIVVEASKFVIGDGILAAFGPRHRAQRKVAAPAFSIPAIQRLTPIFTSNGGRLRTKVRSLIEEGGMELWNNKANELKGAAKDGEKVEHESGIINITEWLDCTTLDIIGKAGFGFNFEALDNGLQSTPLARSFFELMNAATTFGPRRFFLMGIGALTWAKIGTLPLDPTNKVVHSQRGLIDGLARRVVETKLGRIEQELDAEETGGSYVPNLGSKAGAKDGVDEEMDFDVLHLFLKSKVQLERKAKKEGGKVDMMGMNELAGQVRTFLIAGYETISVSTSWAIHFLTLDQRVQDELRKELRKYLEDLAEEEGEDVNDPAIYERELSYEQLYDSKLKWLTNVCLETLRMVPPVISNERRAKVDMVVPLTVPVPKKGGGTMTSIPIKAGTRLKVGYKAAGWDERFFGPETNKWIPERFERLPEAHASSFGFAPYHIPAFATGAKSCIGQRFAMTEFRALLFALIPTIRFLPGPWKVVPEAGITTRPTVRFDPSDVKRLAAMPVRAERIH